MRFKPVFDKHIYRTNLNGYFLFKHFHLSGVLFLKSLQDSSVRVVFQNELGYTFFDFGWDKNDSFAVHSITPQMNKRAVINTLRKDFEVLLMRGLDTGRQKVFLRKGYPVYRFPYMKGSVYYSTVRDKHRSVRQGLYDIYITGKKKTVVMVFLFKKDKPSAMPDEVTFDHLGITHGMTILNGSIQNADTVSNAE